MSEINVTPFVDVMLVLLIVFMIAAPLLTIGVPLRLPSGAAAPLPTDLGEPLNIHVDGTGQVFIQDARVADADLIPTLRTIIQERGAGRVYVRADQSITYGRAMTVLGALNTSGFQDFGLVMDSGGSDGEDDDEPALR